MSRPDAPPLGRDLVATLALTSYTIAVAVGFGRVFSGWDFLPEMVLIALVGHGASFVMRRARLTGWVAVPLLGVLGVWLISMLYFRDTMARYVPGSATWDRASAELDLVREQFPTAVAPVLYGAGWAPLAGLALVLVVVMSDSFAFRAEARGEALVPGGVLFVFIAALGSGRMEIGSAVLLVGTGVAAAIALRRLHDRTRTTTLSARSRRIPFTAPAAAATAVCIALLAGVIGPRLPGAYAEPLYDAKGGSGTTLVNSPFVDIRSRLTNLGNVELFRVNADRAEYWRLITLAQFDGERFTLPDSPLDDVEPVPVDPDDERRIRQQIQILALQGELVPAAADPIQASLTRADGQRLGLRQQPDSSTLISPEELAPGDLFDIVSVSPSPEADDLRSSRVGTPPDPVYLELPDDLPDVVYEQTTALAAGATSPFDAALTIQNWFRDPNEFTYSLEVQSGHGSNAIESFFRNRAGYCEQFSATFAAMARVAGIPSRVAVGYTPGVADPDEPGWYSVIGKNAHAWPELWFDDVGWVMFEPTPGRGSASAAAYTGVPAQQDESGPAAAGGEVGAGSGLVPQPTAPPTVVDGQGPPTPTTVSPRSDGAEELPEGGLVLPEFGDEPFDDFASGAAEGSRSFPWLPVLVVVAVLLVVFGPWLARVALRWRRRHQSGYEQIVAAWSHARSVAAEAGVAGTPSMTPCEWAESTARVLPAATRPMTSLAEAVDRVTFAAPGTVDFDSDDSFGDQLGDDCQQWSEQVDMVAVDTMGTPQRAKRYFLSYR